MTTEALEHDGPPPVPFLPIPPRLLVHPDAEHGVAVAARSLAIAVERLTGSARAIDPDEIVASPPARAHIHFTDRLWAASPETAAQKIEQLARSTTLTATLHDLPQESDGAENLARRSRCYARVVAACSGVIVNSRHEAALLLDHCGVDPERTRVAVIPLPVAVVPTPNRRPDADGTVGVLGFFYPGKGHSEVVDAVAQLPSPPRVTVLGRASSGHEEELQALVDAAARRGIAVEVTEWLQDAELLRRSRSVAVPVAAHRHLSASGSIASWIAAGRRPLVVSSRYAREMAELRPGTLTLVDDDSLADAVAHALDSPDTTWLAPDAVLRPHDADTAAAYLTWFDGGLS